MVQIIFDDTSAVPNEIRSVAGVSNFGSIVYRRKSLHDATNALARSAGWPSPIHLRSRSDITALSEIVRKEDDNQLYLVCPSYLVPSLDPDAVLIFLQQIEHAPMPLYMFIEDSEGRRGWTLMGVPLLRLYLRKYEGGDLDSFFEEHGERFVHVHDRLPLIDLRDESVLQEFLSGQFDTRHFNSVERDRYTVVKRSENREKLRQEFDYYRLVPPAMQAFLVQPFNFADDGKVASYRMERVGVPDMAMQWINGAIEAHEFERFLAHVFYFIETRPQKESSQSECSSVHNFLYHDKLMNRIAALKAQPTYAALEPLFDRAFGGIDKLVARYFDLYKSAQRRSHLDRLVIGHGDLCFSNIFYSKSSQYLKLIDPRGASNEAELYTDPYYDVAKLSHSIQGAYDFLNNDKFDIAVNSMLSLDLRIEGATTSWATELFRDRLKIAGFEPTLVRLYEASLFISMLPLHTDRLRKVMAFALTAANILDDLSLRGA